MSDDLPLGDRMKRYERGSLMSSPALPAQTYTIMRLDGKAFHTFTKGYDKPFDYGIAASMQQTMKLLMGVIPGTKLGYTQSDEISLLLTDFETPNTQAWYGGKIQKIVSISASMASVYFNREIEGYNKALANITGTNPRQNKSPALFDSRVFTLPDSEAVQDYFVWRYRDAYRNGVSAAAQAYHSPNKLKGVKTLEKIVLLDVETGIDYFSEYPQGHRLGYMGYRESYEDTVTYQRKDTGETLSENVSRTRIVSNPAPEEDLNGFLKGKIPQKPL